MLRKTWMLPFVLLAALSGCAQQTTTSQGLPWWGWVIIILVIFLLFWLVFRSRPEEEVKTPPLTPKVEAPQHAAEVVTAAAEVKAPDNPVEAASPAPQVEMQLPDQAAAAMAAAPEAVMPDMPVEPVAEAPQLEMVDKAAEVMPAVPEMPMSDKAAEIPMASASAPIKPDDLTIIEGIGPKINGILQAAGVNTFYQLAALEPQHILEILTAGGIRLADPKSWPEQARLAAHGEMDRLKAYQDTLKGGRMA